MTLQSPHIYRVLEAATASVMHTKPVSARSRIYVGILLLAAATDYDYFAFSCTSYGPTATEPILPFRSLSDNAQMRLLFWGLRVGGD